MSVIGVYVRLGLRIMNGVFPRLAISTGLLFLFPAGATAQGFVVPKGVTVTTTQTLGNNETGTVEKGGAIETTGVGEDGILAGNNNIITNNGSISTTGNDADGIEAGNSNIITNTGSILTGGTAADGIQAGNSNLITNSGSIVTMGDSADGIFGSNGNTVTNSGTIIAIGPNSFSINFLSGSNSLTLLQRSRIVGLISLGSDTDTVNLGRGENWLITFDAGNGGPETLNTFGVPTAILNGGLTVATFDPATTVFGKEDDALSDLMDAIRGGLDQRLTAGNPTTYLWAHGFGGRRDGDTDRGAFIEAGGDHDFGGGMIGFSTPLFATARGGLFAGYSEGDIESERAGSIGGNGRRHEIETEDVFGGLYGRAYWGQAFADVIVTGGSSDRKSRRRILNNLVPTGVEFATASYDGWFISPEVTVGVEAPFAGVTLVPSASVGYAGLFLDGFTETGSLAAISVGDRDIHLIDGRLQLEVRNAWTDTFGAWRSAFRGGVKGRVNAGDDDLTGVLAQTTAFNVTVDDDESIGALFAGGDVTYSPVANVQLYVGAEGAIESEGDTVLTGRAGGAVKF